MKSHSLPSLIEEDVLCIAACVVGTFAVWFLTAAADTWEDGVETETDCTDEVG